MAVRTDFVAGEVLAAQDLDDTFASKLNLAGGKILQVVRATDGTDRSTSSASYVDVTGMSVTITPQRSNSAIIVVATFDLLGLANAGTNIVAGAQITDSSNNAINGANDCRLQINASASVTALAAAQNLWAYVLPATTSPVTYKLRFRISSGTTVSIGNSSNQRGQMFAIEVSA